VASISGAGDKSTLDIKKNSLTIKLSEMSLKVEAVPNAEFPVDGTKVSEELMKFESPIDFEIVFKMTDGDCSSIYESKDMDRTYVENCVRV